MGSPLSVVLSGIFMTKLEKDVVYAESPILYRRFVDDIFNRKKINVEDTLLPKLNSYHHKTKFTVEMKLDKFLDTKMKKSEDGQYETSVNRNRKKPMHWTSKVPKKIKRNIITNDLHRAKKISSDFAKEKDIITLKYVNAGYPKRFIESIARDFAEKQNKPRVEEEQSDQATVEREQNDQATVEREQKDQKTFVPIRIPFCEKNEKVARHFIEKLKKFAGIDFTFTIIWQSKKVKNLFRVKDPVKHKANVIYRGTSEENPEISYVGETKLIAEARWNQHENPNHDSAPSKYLTNHTEDTLSWEILTGSSTNWLKRKIHEALFIRKLNPVLNRQIQHKKLHLFRNGVT